MYWDDEYDEDVPFSFEGEVDLEELEVAMAEFINLDEYKCIFCDTHKTNTGTYHVWKFDPVN